MARVRFAEPAGTPPHYSRWPDVYVHPGEFKSVLDRPRPDDLEAWERYRDRFRELPGRYRQRTRRRTDCKEHTTKALLARIGDTAIDPDCEGAHTFFQHVKCYVVIEHTRQTSLDPVGAPNENWVEDGQSFVCSFGCLLVQLSVLLETSTRFGGEHRPSATLGRVQTVVVISPSHHVRTQQAQCSRCRIESTVHMPGMLTAGLGSSIESVPTHPIHIAAGSPDG
jgi:hypothetical protein